MNLSRSLTLIFLALISVSTSAQEIETNVKLDRPFRADGISNEWNEPLNQYNTDTKLAFALANDDKNLYIVIESLDPATTRTILFGGITLNINTAGKKKSGINLIFPFRDKPQVPKGERPADSLKMEEFGKQLPLESIIERTGMPPVENHGIKVSGFKNIKDGVLTVQNEHGIESGMSIKPNQDLIYEIAIPLAQLSINLDWKKAIAYNIKLNAAKSPMGDKARTGHSDAGGGKPGGGMGGPGGMNGGMGGAGHGGGGQRPPQEGNGNDNSKKSDFWIKYKLVKA